MDCEYMWSPNYTKGRRMPPDIIVVHQTNGSAAATKDWFMLKASKVSAHFLVDKKGAVTQFVSIDDTAWANGTTVDTKTVGAYYKKATSEIVRGRKENANTYTVSIEFESSIGDWFNPLLPGQYLAGASLLLYIKGYVKDAWGVDIQLDTKHVIRHCAVAPYTKPLCGAGIDVAQLIKTTELIL